MRVELIVLLAATAALRLQFSAPTSRSLPHVWTSTGFSPEGRVPGWAWPLSLTPDESTAMALIGSLRNATFTHVRIHWLLDFVTASVDPLDAGQLELEWGALDATLALLLRYGLRPGFEVMGSPSGLVGDARDPTQRSRLRYLLLRLTQRYAQRWGASELREWRFETWNEPDVRKYFDRPLEAFLAYAHTTAQALGEAGLGVGGPAGLLRQHHLRCWALVDDANRRRPPLLNFLSFHRKGNASADQVVEGTRAAIAELRARAPALASLPMVNDEADMLSGWWRACAWRADVRYAAMVARTATLLVDDVAVLSNDNAFLPATPHHFQQRTLLARFPHPHGHAHFFVKPVAVALALMALIGDRRIDVTVDTPDDRLSVLSGAWTRADGVYEAATLLSFGADAIVTPQLLDVLVAPHCDGVGCDDARFALLLLDNVRTNPAQVWAAAGVPSMPGADLRRHMRDAQGPFRAIAAAPLAPHVALTLRAPSVALLQVCGRRAVPPSAPMALHALHTAPGEVTLLWQDVDTRCLLGFEVESRSGAASEWRRIASDVFLTQWHDDVAAFEYRVRAVDLWDRPGPFSATCRP